MADPTQLLQPILSLATTIHINYAEYYQAFGSLPASLDDLGLTESDLPAARISHLWIDPRSGTLMLALPAPLGMSQWLAFRPKLSGFGIRGWRCETTLDINQAPLGCFANASWFDLTQ